ncbi:VOC family protein [Sporosarcina highlanderae]|uniref:VOC family protein n=1 Tax=Sporosarcina highlanderae TaxID=3035916 RepID=A0ABT8JMY5_9BACL|nr:VOC family protein [Sporosarcina highlanderae]MDN4606402.1 VOC family protein [Sporosarcina highlanderae]
MMKLDHVVYFTSKSPNEVVQEQKEKGNHAVIGGRHEKWGTHNALMYVKNAYVEWLSVEKPELAREVDHPLTRLLLHDVTDGDGWGTICLSVTNIEQFNDDIKNKGFATSGVLDAERLTESGVLRKWKMLFVDQPVTAELPYPFFIEWEEPEDVRFAQLRKDGTLIEENDAKEIQECIFGVEDPLRDTGEWAVLLSQKVGDSNDISLENVRLRFIQQEGGKDRLSDVVIGKREG